ncbi:acetaldehyde dehydrogenase (acetylating) [Fredinandcohnia quinoae]|uniref:Acetaldehyde dehydrogenase (Acetylating) n=1 Tax=Fredinandcohnia quinoae TaxID=2918902 RepID=A0AAW5DUI6_9BACI|nr:acetaldehyde dehydrogenase (acetylating) [Fredinandcohnia sp. SECRCQ15]MCH1624023.1 acetaldehyde dehydrogenase (acetylating) [Fredinandcohnia sp. SECRCQ15]
MELDRDLLSIQEVRNKVTLSKIAQEKLEQHSQNNIDKIVFNMVEKAVQHATELAELAVEETGFGNVRDKVIKNLFASENVYEAIKDMKTVGIIHEDVEKKVWEIAAPFGVIAGIVPSTNPTSTIIFKALIAIKARNTIIFSPHPSALKCSLLAAKIMHDAAIQAGAPENCILCLEHPAFESSKELMSHREVDLVLATGGPGMVKSAYSSGKPAYGVGPGNVPVYVHESADLKQAAKYIIESKSFDHGTICASEQSVVVDERIKAQFIIELKNAGAYVLEKEEKEKLASIILDNKRLNAGIVGKSPKWLAEKAGFHVPSATKVIVGEEEEIAKNIPFAIEKLSPILAFYTVKNWREGCETCMHLLEVGGLGHTLGIHATDDAVIREFALKKPASRIVINTGTTFGGIGATTGIFPSMTLGCGSFGNNITSDNIGPQHLMNIKRVAFGIREMYPEVNRVEESPSVELGISEEDIKRIVEQVLSKL